MFIKCHDCEIEPSSCICLHCFLNGNHKNHDYLVCPNTRGNCDCGDLTLWKHTGCCKDHQGIDVDDHPENYLDENLRNTLTDIIFKAAFASFPRLQGKTEQYVSPIFQFISSFLKFGDGFRRLISISLTERIKFNILLSQVFEYKLFFNNKEESDILIELIKSISGLIITYEIRLRSLPDCPDSSKNKILSRNLFLTTWYWYRMINKPNIEN